MASAKPNIVTPQQVADGIYAIDTDYVRRGLDASHLLVADGRAAFIDCGTRHSVANLLAALDALGIGRDQVDYLFLTHIHLDHAGGGGTLIGALPNARALIHPRGAKHMIRPSKLIAGATAVYGEARFKSLYGSIEPIPSARVVEAVDGQTVTVGDRTLRLFFTEGHARHHYCLHDPAAAAVFTGDSFGLSYRVFDSDAGAFVFPTTTPVHFDPLAAHASVDRIVATGAETALLTHYSAVRDLPGAAAQLHADLDRFVAIAERHASDDQREALMKAAMSAYLNARLDAHGSATDTATRAQWLDMDIALNVQGLLHWLDTIQ